MATTLTQVTYNLMLAGRRDEAAGGLNYMWQTEGWLVLATLYLVFVRLQRMRVLVGRDSDIGGWTSAWTDKEHSSRMPLGAVDYEWVEHQQRIDGRDARLFLR